MLAEPDLSEQNQVLKPVEVARRNVENFSYSSTSEPDRSLLGGMSNNAYNGREESAPTFSAPEREWVDMKNYGSSSSHRLYSSAQDTFNAPDEEKVPKVSPPRRKCPREEKPEKQSNWLRKDSGSELPVINHKHQRSYDSSSNNTRQYEQEDACDDREINALLEVQSLAPCIFFGLL